MENRPVNINLRSADSNNMIYNRNQAASERNNNSPSAGLLEKDSGFILKVLDKVLLVSVFMLFLGVPLFFTGLTFQGIIFEKQVYFYFWLLIALVSWATKGVITGEMNIRRTPLDILIGGFWISYLLATIFSIDRWHSFWGDFGDPSRSFMSVTALILAYYVLMSNFSKKLLNLALGAIIISGSFLSVWTLLSLLGIKFLPTLLYSFAPVSLIGSISGVGAFISFLIPILILGILKVADADGGKLWLKRILKVAMLLVMIVDFVILLAIYNYIPIEALLVGISLFLIFVLAKIVRPNVNWVWLPMAVFVIVMAIMMTKELPIYKISLPVEVSPNYQTSWQIALSSLKEKFVLGTGPATYSYDFALNRPQDFNNNTFYQATFYQARGILFEAIPTLGALGTFFFVLLILSFLSIELYLLSKNKEKNKLYSLFLLSGSLTLLVYALSARIEGTLVIMASLVSILSLATIMSESDSEEKFVGLSLKASPKFALALAFIFMVVSAGVAFFVVFLGKVYAADIYAGQSLRSGNDQNIEQPIIEMGKAIRLYDKEGRYYTQLSQYYMALANVEAMKGVNDRDVQKIQQYLNYSIAAAQQGKDMLKNDVVALESLAQVYENAGIYVPDSLSLAEDTYKRGLDLKPNYPDFYEKLGELKISEASAKKDQSERESLIKEANDLFQKSVDSKPNYALGYYQLSLTQDALNQKDQAIDSGVKAVQLDPQNESYILSLARIYQVRGNDDDLKTAEQLYQLVISRNDKSVNGHFYLGLLYEKTKNKQGAKDQYQKVISILPDNSDDTKKQLQKMVDNVDKGIENTPETLGLTKNTDNSSDSSAQTGQAGQ